MVWTNARTPGARERGMGRRSMEPGGAYQRSPSSSVTYPPPDSSVVQVSYPSEQVGVFPLPLHELLRFAEQVHDPLYLSWVWALAFALAESCLCRRRGLLSGKHGFRCALVPLFSRSSPWRWCHRY